MANDRELHWFCEMRIKELESKLGESLAARKESLRKLVELESRLGELQTLVADSVPRSRVTAMDEEITTLGAKLSKVQKDAGAEIERLQSSLDSVRQLAANHGAMPGTALHSWAGKILGAIDGTAVEKPEQNPSPDDIRLGRMVDW